MRPWRLLIEVGDKDQTVPLPLQSATTSSPPPPLDSSIAWDLLVEGRRRLVQALRDGEEEKVEQINQWLGGGIAILATFLSDSAETLLERLREEVPAPPTSGLYDHLGTFVPVERSRPKPPPGAQRPIDPAELSEEEREKYGIDLPDPEA